jgi:hypothetical protein
MEWALNMRLRATALVLLLAFALAGAGFAHRAPSSADVTMEVAALAGFAADDLCAQYGMDGSQAGAPCLACTTVGPALVPLAGCAARPAGLKPASVILSQRGASHWRPSVLDPAHGTRGPPLV